MRNILQDNIGARNTWLFWQFLGQCMRVGIKSAKRWTIEQFTVFRINRTEWNVIRHFVSLTSIEENNREVDPGTLPPLRWNSACQGYLICFWKGAKEFNRHTCHWKKLRGIQFLDPNWLSRNTIGMASIVSLV